MMGNDVEMAAAQTALTLRNRRGKGLSFPSNSLEMRERISVGGSSADRHKLMPPRKTRRSTLAHVALKGKLNRANAVLILKGRHKLVMQRLSGIQNLAGRPVVRIFRRACPGD